MLYGLRNIPDGTHFDVAVATSSVPVSSSSKSNIKQLLDKVEHDIMNYQNRGLCYLPKPKASADNTDTRF